VTLRISVRIPPCVPAPELARAAARCEVLGYDGVWFPDSQLLWRDPFVAAALTLQRTTTLTVGIAVSNVVTRHLSVLAGLYRSVAELDPARFALGLGSGSSSTGTVGLRPARTGELREAIEILRRLGRGEEHDFGSGPVRLEAPTELRGLFLAATGTRNLALAGELADGVIVLNGSDQAALRRSLAHVREGERSRASALGPVRRLMTSFCLPTDEPERDARLLKPICVAMAHHLGAASALEECGVRVGAGEPSAPVYPDLIHAQDWAHAVAAVDHLVSDADVLTFAQKFCLFGSVAAIRGQLTAMAAAGVEEVLLQHLGSFSVPYEWVETCSELLEIPATVGGS
jgi:5,10-methylenetetrahydromethanopterin reductase